MGEPSAAMLPHSEHYRELASKLRGIAYQSHIPSTREKIFKLALWYEVRANHLDARNSGAGSAEDAG